MHLTALHTRFHSIPIVDVCYQFRLDYRQQIIMSHTIVIHALYLSLSILPLNSVANAPHSIRELWCLEDIVFFFALYLLSLVRLLLTLIRINLVDIFSVLCDCSIYYVSRLRVGVDACSIFNLIQLSKRHIYTHNNVAIVVGYRR